ncbi:hypothetical protein [Curtobacterium sp. 24E2]
MATGCGELQVDAGAFGQGRNSSTMSAASAAGTDGSVSSCTACAS